LCHLALHLRAAEQDSTRERFLRQRRAVVRVALVRKLFAPCSPGTACARKCQENVSGDNEDLAPASLDADADDRAELERDEVDKPLSNSNHLLMIDRVALAQILSTALIHVRIVFWVLVRPAETRGGARIERERRTPMSSSTVVIYYNILLLHLLQKKCSTQR